MTERSGRRTRSVGGSQRPRRSRLDAELVRRGLARSRDHAAQLIAAGRVGVAGAATVKPATRVSRDVPITVSGAVHEPAYVSRGGRKLAGALAIFGADGNAGTLDGHPTGLTVADRFCLDAGASTGGFTDVLLRAGAAHVVAVDVGYGQLAWSLRVDPRVTVLDRVNVRSLRPDQVTVAGRLPDLVVADLSFISLTLVLPSLVDCTATDADLVLLVKPQFEVGRGRVGRGGVVRDAQARAAAVTAVCTKAATLGLGVRGIAASPLPGPAGNREYFVWLRPGAAPLDETNLWRVIRQADPPSDAARDEGTGPNRARAVT